MTYITVREAAVSEFIERKSRFIGQVKPVTTEEEAMDFINSVRAQYPDASHNVWAYNLRNARCRYSDDGEPSGTAGPPVLDVLKKESVEDAAVVVTRYFGGILLGAGGLVRAYSRSAHDALEAGGICQVYPCVDLRLSVDYGLYGKLEYMLPSYCARVLDTQFGGNVTLCIRLRAERADSFRNALREMSAGRLTAETVAECYGDLE